MKRILIITTAAVMLAACAGVEQPRLSDARVAAAEYASFSEGMIANVEPQGWLLEALQRQNEGLTGHPKALSYPYNSCLWAGEIERSGPHGSGWWRYEQTAYYTDGLLRLGYELADSALIAKGEEGVEYTLSHVTPEGVLGVHDPYMLEGDNFSQWPFAVFFRAMQAKYEATADERIPAALEKHYLSFPVEYYRGRSAVNVEGILWTYSLTGNEELLKLAEAVWEHGEFYLNKERCSSDEPVYQHGVTYCEEMKIPMILYAHTGKQEYLEAAIRADSLMEAPNMLPDGVISSAEHFAGQDPTHSHETCDITDYTWTMGYFLMATGDAQWADRIEKAVLNAGFGCVTKDFKALQYFSSPNQFIATGTSNNNDFMRGRTWMAYRPTHQTECCAGNVHRILPNYVARMWMRGGQDEAVLALYGPSKAHFRLADGTICTITEKTEYPFGDDVRLRVEFSRDGRRVRSHALKLSYRIPEGCTLDGQQGGFRRVEKTFRSGECVKLSFKAEPQIKKTEGGVYVQRGPLVYACAIPSKVAVDTVTYVYMHGKRPDEPGFDCLDMTPDGPWNWSLAADAEPVFRRTATAGYPWENSPVSITIPASGFDGWELEEGNFTPHMPDSTVTAGDPQQIILIPYGCTTLRLTVFPLNNR